MEYNFTHFCRSAAELGVELTEAQRRQFIRYYELLIERNRVMNLTAITEFGDVVDKHFIDSLSLVKATGDLGEADLTLIDVGTGAGFPGIPLKIAFPAIRLTLLDSLQKRVRFLDEVIAELHLEDVITLHGRAEDYARRPEYRERFDLCVSRAVANLATLAEYALPFVKVGGRFIPYKSGKADEEKTQAAGAIKTLGGTIETDIKFNLPGADIERNLLVIRKQKNTPKKYPRKAGTPAKEPLQ